MSPVTFEEAFNATNPDMHEDARKEAAQRLMQGVAANDAYWNSRSELEQYVARSQGHGTVVAPPAEAPAEELAPGHDAETTAVEEPDHSTVGLAPGSAVEESDTAERLREQLRARGIAPEA